MENQVVTLEVAGRRIHELRGGQGRPLLYLHSVAGEAVWLPFLTQLAARRELHAPAHPGWLGSEGLDEIEDVEDLVYHYLDYFDVLGWESVDVVGLSFGGWVGAEIAARYPERISRLVLAGSVGLWLPERPLADLFALDSRFPERFRDLLFHDTGCPAAQLMGSQFGPEVPEATLVNVMNAFAAAAHFGWNPLLHDPRLERLLRRVTAPTLCLWGAHDRVSPVEYGEAFAKRIPGARLEIVPECGHMIPLEKPEAFVRSVLGFLD